MLIWAKKVEHYNLKKIKKFECVYKNKKKDVKFGE